MRASSLLTIEMETDSIPTSSFKLDTALNKGIQLCSITEICGGSGSGKTQICLQLTFNTILPAPVGLIDGEAVYISTKRNFHQLRVNHLAENCVKIWEAGRGKSRAVETRKTFTTKDALDRIHHKLVFNAADLMSTVYQLKTMVKQNKKIRLIVIDSLSALHRNFEPLEKIRILYEMIHVLQIIASLHNCAVFVTNDLTPHIDSSCAVPTAPTIMKPALGVAFHHRISQRILLCKSDKPEIIIAKVQKSLTKGPAQVKLEITKDGIKDA